MSSAQHLLASHGYAPTHIGPAPLHASRRPGPLLIGIVLLLLACWLPLMTHLAVEKSQGGGFGLASVTQQAVSPVLWSASRR